MCLILVIIHSSLNKVIRITYHSTIRHTAAKSPFIPNLIYDPNGSLLCQRRTGPPGFGSLPPLPIGLLTGRLLINIVLIGMVLYVCILYLIFLFCLFFFM